MKTPLMTERFADPQPERNADQRAGNGSAEIKREALPILAHPEMRRVESEGGKGGEAAKHARHQQQPRARHPLGGNGEQPVAKAHDEAADEVHEKRAPWPARKGGEGAEALRGREAQPVAQDRSEPASDENEKNGPHRPRSLRSFSHQSSRFRISRSKPRSGGS